MVFLKISFELCEALFSTIKARNIQRLLFFPGVYAEWAGKVLIKIITP
jgi:hypothetical protein